MCVCVYVCFRVFVFVLCLNKGLFETNSRYNGSSCAHQHAFSLYTCSVLLLMLLKQYSCMILHSDNNYDIHGLPVTEVEVRFVGRSSRSSF